jgi:hypothetical protein
MDHCNSAIRVKKKEEKSIAESEDKGKAETSYNFSYVLSTHETILK